MPEFWESCDAKSRALLGYLYKQECGCFPEWDERSGKSYKPKPSIYPNIEPEPDPEIVREMRKPPHSPEYPV